MMDNSNFRFNVYNFISWIALAYVVYIYNISPISVYENLTPLIQVEDANCVEVLKAPEVMSVYKTAIC